MSRPAKKTKSAKIDVVQMRHVRRFFGPRTDSEAMSRAIDLADERRLLHEYLVRHNGKLPPMDWHDYGPK
jgi:hypothetical protein